MNYYKYAKNVHSQNGEDGIIEKIFEKLNINDGYVCEFGAWDGIHLSNTYNIYKNNSDFIPILIESESDFFKKMEKTLSDIERKITLNKFVSPDINSENCLDNILESLGIKDLKNKFRLLSIDIDSCDYEIWDSLKKYRPTVVVIEVNSSYPPPEEVYPCTPSGASAGIVNKLAKRKEYELVCHTGNLIFVVKEEFEKLGIEDNSLEKLFLRNWC